MADKKQQKGLLRPETMKKLREGLWESDKYTDEELENTVFFMVVGPIQAGAQIGAADGSIISMAVISDLIANALLATYINHGALDPKAIYAFTQKTNSGKITAAQEIADRGVPAQA